MIGMMQGRLLPVVEGRIQAFPRERWEEEFASAAAAGLDAIEWIYDTHGLGANPIETAAGIARVVELSRRHKIAVRSLCANYFMDFMFVRASERERLERTEHLIWLLGQARQMGVSRIVLPLLEQSDIVSEADRVAVVDSLGRALPCSRATGVELHLETSLPPAGLAELMTRIGDPCVKVAYDSGNSASYGYRPAEEFEAYGDRLGSVHIKDRILGGRSVRLGEGNVDFDAVFGGLRALDYNGDFILEVPRGQPGEEVTSARWNRNVVHRFVSASPVFAESDLGKDLQQPRAV